MPLIRNRWVGDGKIHTPGLRTLEASLEVAKKMRKSCRLRGVRHAICEHKPGHVMVTTGQSITTFFRAEAEVFHDAELEYWDSKVEDLKSRIKTMRKETQ